MELVGIGKGRKLRIGKARPEKGGEPGGELVVADGLGSLPRRRLLEVIEKRRRHEHASEKHADRVVVGNLLAAELRVERTEPFHL